jgi:tryptophanyl-tRNA synthetase
MSNSLGGAHLSKNGLHLGHFYGSVQPYINKRKDDVYYFVVRDRGSAYKNNDIENYDNFKRIASQIFAINEAFSLELKVIRQSKISPFFHEITDEFFNRCTLKQLINAHPLSYRIKNNDHNILLSDFLFMTETAVTIALLDIERVFFTGNDSTIVKFSRMLIDKLNKSNNLNLSLPRIQLQKHQIMKGYNYKKMNQDNNNCIYFSDSKEVLEHKLRKLFDFKYLFKNNKHFRHSYLSDRNAYTYPDAFMPLVYIRQFSETPHIIIERDLNNPANRNELYTVLYTTISKIINPNKMKANVLLLSSGLRDKIQDNEIEVMKKVTEKHEEICRNI